MSMLFCSHHPGPRYQFSELKNDESRESADEEEPSALAGEEETEGGSVHELVLGWAAGVGGSEAEGGAALRTMGS